MVLIKKYKGKGTSSPLAAYTVKRGNRCFRTRTSLAWASRTVSNARI